MHATIHSFPRVEIEEWNFYVIQFLSVIIITSLLPTNLRWLLQTEVECPTRSWKKFSLVWGPPSRTGCQFHQTCITNINTQIVLPPTSMALYRHIFIR